MAKVYKAEYGAPVSAVYDAARRAVTELGYELRDFEGGAGTVEFNTGRSWRTFNGVNMRATCTDSGAGSARVELEGGIAWHHTHQMYDWGEKGSVAKKYLAAIDTALQTATGTQ